MEIPGESASGRFTFFIRLSLIFMCAVSAIACKKRIDPNDPLNGLRAGDRRSISLAPGVMMEFRWVPAGQITKSSTVELSGSTAPTPEVIKVKNGFWMSSCEIPRGVWKRVMTPDVAEPPEKADFPVDSVSWSESMDFIKRLEKPGRHWRFDLPTDAQWEYACRAGSSAEFYGDPLQIGWVEGNSDGGTHPVGQLSPNSWGLCDMHGNVAEWCRDSPAGKDAEKIIRGGSWASDWHAQASVRNSDVPGLKFDQVGFRLIIRREDP